MKRCAYLERLQSAGKGSVNEQRLFFNLPQPLPFSPPTVIYPPQPLPSHCNTIMDDQIPAGLAPSSIPRPASHTPHPDLPSPPPLLFPSSLPPIEQAYIAEGAFPKYPIQKWLEGGLGGGVILKYYSFSQYCVNSFLQPAFQNSEAAGSTVLPRIIPAVCQNSGHA